MDIIGMLFLGIIATATLYCGPNIFLRYVVFQKKISPKKALVCTLISTSIVFIGIRIFTDYMYGTVNTNANPAALWGLISYFILADTKKKNKKGNKELIADTKQQESLSSVQIPEAKTITKEKMWIAAQLQETSEWSKSMVDEVRNLISKTKHIISRVYSILVTILAIVFLCLSIKFYNDYQDARSPLRFYRDASGNLCRIIGYYSSTGELIPYDKYSPQRFFREVDGKLCEIIGYYSSTGELIPFYSEED